MMGKYSILAPGIAVAVYISVAFTIFSIRTFLGKVPVVDSNGRASSQIIGKFILNFWLWLISPIEALIVGGLVAPNTITALALVACVGSGTAIAFGFLATGGWLYILSGTLDILDGRLARATNQTSAAGGFLDSVADRFGEIAVFAGWAWYLRTNSWSFAAVVALGGSMMVSYVRAAGEARGTELKGGLMQRPERVLIVSVGTLACALMSVSSFADQIPLVAGIILMVVGLGSLFTAAGRWRQGFLALQETSAAPQGPRATASARVLPTSITPVASAPTSSTIAVPPSAVLDDTDKAAICLHSA